jgi:hypothetical protein
VHPVFQGPSEGVSLCGERATVPYEYICNSSYRPKFVCELVHNGGGAMWRLSNAQALIFIAARVVMVAVSPVLLA